MAPERARWAVRTFDPFKADVPDGIFLALLQRGLEVLVTPPREALPGVPCLRVCPL